MDNHQLTHIPVSAISDIAVILKDKGLTDEKITEVLRDIASEVEIEVVESIVNKLSDEEQAHLYAMVDQKKSYDEIASVLNLNIDEIKKIELQKFAEVVESLSSVLGL